MNIKALVLVLIVSVSWSSCTNMDNTTGEKQKNVETAGQEWSIVIHGGAGPMAKGQFSHTKVEMNWMQPLWTDRTWMRERLLLLPI